MNLLPARLAIVDGCLRAEAAGLSIAVSPAQARALDRHAGDRVVVLGFRPEALRLTPSGPTAQRVEVVTVALEALGSEIVLVGELAGPGAEIAARLPAETRIAEGAPVSLHLDPAELHLFDPGSGRALPRRPDQLT
jgi:ABC-type sugar transport system ATPase subunit